MEDKGYSDVGYNYFIDMDGTIYEGRGLRVEGGHTHRYNCDAYGVAFLGNFVDKSPSNAAISAISAFSKLRDVSNSIFINYIGT